MPIRARLLVMMLAVCLVSTSATATVFGPSNLSFSGYPDPRCYEPSIPFSDEDFAWDMFRSQLRSYVDCVNEYVEAGDNDIQRIRDAQAEAVRDAENFMRRARR